MDVRGTIAGVDLPSSENLPSYEKIRAMDRLPFRAAQIGFPYESMGTLPVTIVLDNVRSMYNVGSFFRTADAASAELLVLTGITACPPKSGIRKTALGAEESTRWESTLPSCPLH